MSAKKQQEPKSRPFPWLCSDCVTRTVVPTVIDFTTKVKHDGVIHVMVRHIVSCGFLRQLRRTLIEAGADRKRTRFG